MPIVTKIGSFDAAITRSTAYFTCQKAKIRRRIYDVSVTIDLDSKAVTIHRTDKHGNLWINDPNRMV